MLDQIRRALEANRPQRIERDGLPRAGVLIPIYVQDGVPHVLLTVRSEQVEHHKGQISFPGGMQDAGDQDLAATALRETEEEIGLRRDHVEVWGQLDDIVTISDFIVSPYVGRVTKPAPYPFTPSEIEVAELLAVPLPHLYGPDGLNMEPASWRGQVVRGPSYSYGEHLIWGATSRILKQFLDLTRESQP
ncbi:MAG: CoA pyrophosphatase [Chloroflexi bacterium]|nr:CoA pyrophosphatase [Chloroflexota bacterium]